MAKPQTEPVLERPLPQNIEAEAAVLGPALFDNEALDTAIQQLKPSDFFSDPHRHIFRAIVEMREAGAAVDLVTLTESLRRKDELEAAGGAGYVSSLIDGRGSVSNVAHYARIVKEKARLRKLIYAAQALKERAFEGLADADAVAAVSDAFTSGSENGTIFDTRDEFDSAPDPTFSIEGFLQDYGVNALAALSCQGKTWISLNITAALLFGPGVLWDLFQVTERATKVIYLIPEASRSAFKTRLKTMNLYEEIGKRLFVRTLDKGPTLPLCDSRFLREVAGAHLFCDTAIRFMDASSDQNDAMAAAQLSKDFFAIQRAGAKSVIALFHSPKEFEKQTRMTLENMIRGSGEFGAVLSTAWGLRQIDKQKNTIHVQNLKARDFEPCGPLQLVGRPFIDEQGTFHVHSKPGECAELAQYLDDRNRGGAPAGAQDSRTANKELLRTWLREDQGQTSEELSRRFAEAGITVKPGTVRRYRSELEKK